MFFDGTKKKKDYLVELLIDCCKKCGDPCAREIAHTCIKAGMVRDIVMKSDPSSLKGLDDAIEADTAAIEANYYLFVERMFLEKIEYNSDLHDRTEYIINHPELCNLHRLGEKDNVTAGRLFACSFYAMTQKQPDMDVCRKLDAFQIGYLKEKTQSLMK